MNARSAAPQMNSILPAQGSRWRGVIHAYRAHLPVTESTPVVSLNW